MKRIIILLILVIQTSFTQTKFDHSIFDELLIKAVNKNGMVDYQVFKSNKKFNAYLNKVADADVSKFSKEEKLAFYINAYNASVIQNVLNHLPIKSPIDVNGFFKEYKFEVAGENLSLDELENNKVLKIEPVLSHFGLVCAAKSCPKLISNAYGSENIYKQLEENLKVYLNNSSQNYFDRKNKTLHLSQIFNWFRGSFEKRYGSLKNMSAKYMNSSDADFIKKDEIKINFLTYNWDLNSQ